MDIGPKAHVGMWREAASSEPMNRSSDMIERLEHLGVQELTLDEQSGVLGGNDVAAGAGRLLGYVWGLIVKCAMEFEYQNPRFSGEWMG